jgi:hypothetical protein
MPETMGGIRLIRALALSYASESLRYQSRHRDGPDLRDTTSVRLHIPVFSVSVEITVVEHH